MTNPESGRKPMTISLPTIMYQRVKEFSGVNWSEVCRAGIQARLNILEVERDGDRMRQLRALAAADSKSMWDAGYYDGLNYPLDDQLYAKMRRLEDRVGSLIEDNDPENTVQEFRNLNLFEVADPSWDYALGMVHGLLKLKRLAGMSEAQYRHDFLK